MPELIWRNTGDTCRVRDQEEEGGMVRADQRSLGPGLSWQMLVIWPHWYCITFSLCSRKMFNIRKFCYTTGWLVGVKFNMTPWQTDKISLENYRWTKIGISPHSSATVSPLSDIRAGTTRVDHMFRWQFLHLFLPLVITRSIQDIDNFSKSTKLFVKLN